MPDVNTQTTRADAYALSQMPTNPNRWFHPDELHHAIKNRTARCQRLEKMGRLESRVEGEDLHNLRTEYRVKP